MKCVIRNCENRKLKRQMKQALQYYINQLVHKNLSKHLAVTLIFDDQMSSQEYAECYPSQTFTDKPRKFVVRINKNITRKPLLALAHEAIHIKQYAKQELSTCHTFWKNTRVYSTTRYLDLPWEKQAYRYDYTLYKDYKNFCAEQSRNRKT